MFNMPTTSLNIILKYRMKITAETDLNLTKIYIDGILHIAFVRSKLVGLSSWKDYDKHSIELVFDNNASMVVDYSDFDKWKKVLKVVGNVLYP